jgi:hypothetical protein
MISVGPFYQPVLLVCLAWTALLTFDRKLNGDKFLRQIEAELSISLFAIKRKAYRQTDADHCRTSKTWFRPASFCSTS